MMCGATVELTVAVGPSAVAGPTDATTAPASMAAAHDEANVLTTGPPRRRTAFPGFFPAIVGTACMASPGVTNPTPPYPVGPSPTPGPPQAFVRQGRNPLTSGRRGFSGSGP